MKNYSVIIDNIPDRGDKELPATAKQLDYLQHLGIFEDNYLDTLGKWQASYLIEKVKEAKENLAIDIVKSRRKKSTNIRSAWKLAIIFIIAIWGLFKIISPWKEEANKSTPIILSNKLSNKNTESLPPEKTEIIEPPITVFNQLILPTSIISTEDLILKNVDQVAMKVYKGSKITIDKRSESGLLSMTINDKFYSGYEDLLMGKVKLDK